jgi:uncharacterized membrane protein YvbJ
MKNKVFNQLSIIIISIVIVTLILGEIAYQLGRMTNNC